MRVEVDRILAVLEGCLLPPRCVLCAGRGQRPALDLCRDCEADLPVIGSACPGCGLPGPALRCPRCRADPPPFDHGFAPYAYAAPLDGLIHALKYREQLAVARVLGHLLAKAIVARGLQHGVDVLVPVPLHPTRLVERGYNQSLEVARWVGRAIRRPCLPRGLERTRPTPSQVGLPLVERAANLAGAFRTRPGDGFEGRRVAIVDDVMTTGSTAREVARALRAAGADSVVVWCVARTPA